MTENLEFDKPKMWYFSGHVPHIVQPNPGNKLKEPQRQMRPKTIGLIALSFDRAYLKLRDLRPDFRIQHVSMNDANVDLIVDDPVAFAIAEKLTC